MYHVIVWRWMIYNNTSVCRLDVMNVKMMQLSYKKDETDLNIHKCQYTHCYSADWCRLLRHVKSLRDFVQIHRTLR